MSDLFNHLGESYSVEGFEDHILGIDQYLQQIKKEEGDWFTTQDDYDNRVKATMASGSVETNVLLHDIALSLRVLSGRDNKDV